MKNKILITVLFGMMTTTIFTGCSSDKTGSDNNVSGEIDKAAYEQLQADYEELLDYTIFLEQELVRAKGKYAETGAMMDEFIEANEAGNKIVLVEPTTIEDAEKSIEEKSK